VDDLERSAPRKLVASSLSAAFAAPGHLLFSSDTLMAATFDWTKQQLTGEPFPLAPSVAGSSNFFGAFSAADTGVLVYATSAASSELVWIDRAGKQLGRVAPPADYVDFRLSPDDTQLAVAEVDPQSHRPDIRVLDLARGAKVRLTDDAATDASPVWSADGQQIVFRSNRSGLNDLYQKAANGAGPDTLLLQSPSAKYPTDSLPAGRGLVFHTYERETGSDIWLAPAEGAQPAPLVKTKFHQMQGQVSSDGEWLAYASLESGQAQVYVRSLVDATRRWQVSAGGGTDPRWREDARELYYISADSWMTGATITAGAPAAPKRMFQVAAPPPRDPYLSSYDVTGDGSRFLMKVAVQDVTSAPLHVVANWLGARRGP
jgi:dipeptidyl aminopeptidase/acylaminoacyl peptidase